MTEPAVSDPVARVMVDVALPHLDRPFDYLVSAALDDDVRPGSRVRVRFAGRLVDGYVLDRGAPSGERKLAFIERVVGSEPVLTAETMRLCRAVADRFAGNFVDVVRLAIPPRRAGVETETRTAPTAPASPPPEVSHDPAGWSRYPAGQPFLGAVSAGRPARAIWSALPGEDWPRRIAEVMRAAVDAGRGAVAVVPDARDLARLDAAMTAVLGRGRHVALSAELGPTVRYRRWLAVRRGEVLAVIGTRAALYAPVADVGLLVIWDDGDDLHREPRAPYPDARDVLVLRASAAGAALLVGGFARTAEAQQLLESGWAHEIVGSRDQLRARSPRITATGDDFETARDPAARAARLPTVAWRAAHDALAAGEPVLVQVPRAGYVPALACARDRSPARCGNCAGPLGTSSGHAIATCRWCGRPNGDWACPLCGGRRMRAMLVGSARTAEELGRAFPGTRVRISGGASSLGASAAGGASTSGASSARASAGGPSTGNSPTERAVLASIEAGPVLVIATPGAEPVAEGNGYGAALLLDGWSLLARPDLRAAEEALRRWANAAALVRPGGRVVIAADAGVPAVQALIRWDARGAAQRELADRLELAFPPVSRMAALSGATDAVAELIAAAELPVGAELIGPVPVEDGHERLLIRVPREAGAALAAALHLAAGARSARKAPEPVKIVLDPAQLF